MSRDFEKSVMELYDMLEIMEKPYDLNEFPFFNSDGNKHLVWKPLKV